MSLMRRVRSEPVNVTYLEKGLCTLPSGAWERICLLMQETQEMGFNPRVRKIPWRRKWQPTPVFLPGKFRGQKILAGYIHGVTKSHTLLSKHTWSCNAVKDLWMRSGRI